MEKRKVTAVIERAGDGTYSIYMDADDMDYLVTGTGKPSKRLSPCSRADTTTC